MYYVLVKTNEALTNWYPGPIDPVMRPTKEFHASGYAQSVSPTYHIYRQNDGAPFRAMTYEPEELVVVVKTIVTGRASGYVDISVFANSFELLRNLWNITGVDLFHLLQAYSCYTQAMPMMVLEGTPLYQPDDKLAEEESELVSSLRNVDPVKDGKLAANLEAACREASIKERLDVTVRRNVVDKEIMQAMLTPADKHAGYRAIGHLIPYGKSEALLFVVTTADNPDCRNTLIRPYGHINQDFDIRVVAGTADSILKESSSDIKSLVGRINQVYHESGERFIWIGLHGLFTACTTDKPIALWGSGNESFTFVVDQTDVNYLGYAKTAITADGWALIDYKYFLNKKDSWRKPEKVGNLDDILERNKV